MFVKVALREQSRVMRVMRVLYKDKEGQEGEKGAGKGLFFPFSLFPS